MSDYLVNVKTSLRPDPDDSSPEIFSLEANSRVARLRELGSWAKISYTGRNRRTILGWLHADVLEEITAGQITLFDEPFGQSRVVVGEVVEETVQLPPWKKIRVRLADGSEVEGWIDTSSGSVGTGSEDEQPAPGETDDLVLGPNEIYRPHLLRAKEITGIDAAALAALIDAEAAKRPNGQWNANSQAGTSSAAGLTQFLKGTWITHAKTKNTLLNQVGKAKGFVTAGNQVAAGKEPALLNLRFDPELSIVSAAEYGLFNLTALIKAGLVDDDISDDEKAQFIYIAHHEGLDGAKGFLSGTKSYSFADLVTQVGNGRAQAYVDAANGDTTKAYHNWLTDYVVQHIQPSKFRAPGAEASTGVPSAVLAQFAGPPILIADLSSKRELAKAIQWRLMELGYLDPPADGSFGPVSTWALSEFCDLNGIGIETSFTKEIAQRLMSPTAHLPSIAQTGTWFDKVISYMGSQKYFICRHPDCRNIIYLEGVDADGTLNDDVHNVFNDLRIVFSIDRNGRPNFEDWVWDGTTEPGDYWTIHPMNPKGAARIMFNQYKSWAVGQHHPNTPQAHEALVQVAPVSVYRDLNKDFKRPGDVLDTGLFAINQHWGYDAPKGDLGRTSAGCLVGRTKAGHRLFMSVIKEDPRYKVNRSYRFVTAVMPGDQALG